MTEMSELGSVEGKHCPDCNQFLPLSAFGRNVRGKRGLSFYCAACSRVRVLASKRRRLGPPKTRSRQGPKDVPSGFKWCPQCSQVLAIDDFPRNRNQPNGRGAYCRRCHSVNGRALHLRRKYGLTPGDFDRMVSEQKGVCAVCCEAPAVHVDHDHVTGRVRGLLCFNCNGALGQFRDRTDIMLRAMAYLDRHPAELPEYTANVFVGDFESQRPPGETFPPEFGPDSDTDLPEAV